MATIVLAFKAESATPLLWGLIVVPVTCLLHYLAARFVMAGKAVIRAESCAISSTAVLDAVAALSILGRSFS